ncbi:MAG: Flp pilus assembly complex ATPase component TadA [Sedimentisphaerales bacterium]|nr:Flp pilus assembly complex ATPase component TadA [Sedimentisphaerales bacterium]
MARIFGSKKEEPQGLNLVDDYSENDGLEEICGLSHLYSPEQDSAVHVRDIADVLQEMERITESQLSEIRMLHEQTNQDVLKIITEKDFAQEPDISLARANLYHLEFFEIDSEKIDKEAFHKLDLEYIRNNRIMPIGFRDEKLLVATSHPGDLFVMEDVKRQTKMEIETVVCLDNAIDQICQSHNNDKVDYNLDELISDMTDVEIMQDVDEVSEDLEKMAGQSPIIKFVNYLISNAVREGVSDIHIEPKEKSMKTRYRIDGILFETMQSPMKMHPAIVSRIKIMANLDISERRLPQDGKIKVSVGGRAIDLRVSTLPTNHGEKVVIRVLDSKSILRGLEQLGMEKDIEETFSEQVQMPHGIMLVTGPTGSGKSTTLYSALAQMDGDTQNVSTVEDPVEYELDFCNQVQANEKIGLTFASALRSLLRQDPDVIMIGEIRDNETARIAVQAALTGHLVLSTLHTNDAPSSVTRLVDIGIDSYLIAASLNAILAQRLIRKICPKCKEVYQVSDNKQKYIEKAGIAPDQLFHGVGCDQCRGSGYVGRAGIYELLIVDEAFRDMINKDSSINSMRQAFHESGRRSMFDDGMIKVKQGITTIEEVLRVTQVYGTTESEDFAENYSSH